MVRLKVEVTNGDDSTKTNFNSTMVRLKVFNDWRDTVKTLFQFHYGTIKSETIEATLPSVMLFQFHYGTIKSG